MDKIKAFFSNKIVKGICWGVFVLDISALILGGATQADVSDGAKLVFGIAGAIALLIVFLSGKIKKE